MDTINTHERTILELLLKANGRVSAPQLVAGYKRSAGIHNGRTAGVIRLLEAFLRTLHAKAYLRVDEGGEKATPSRRRKSVVGRDVKVYTGREHSDAEKAQMSGVASYRCAFFSITEQGKLALKDASLAV